MKRLLTVALALIMVFTLTATVAAKESPTGKEYYSITVDNEPVDGDLGTAKSDKNQVPYTIEEVDGKVTLTANETNGFFTRWIIDGEYEIVDGSLLTPVLVIIPKSDIHATANFRVDEDYLTMTVSTVGDGTADVNPEKVKVGSDDLVTFEAFDGKETFVEWKLECEYDIVEGDLKSRKLVIRPYTDVHGIAYFVGSETPSAPASSTPASSGGNSSPVSPKTGDPLFTIFGLAVLALGAGALAFRKMKKG